MDVMHESAVLTANVAKLPRVRAAWAAVLTHVAATVAEVALHDVAHILSRLHAPRHYFPTWGALFMWSLPAREELGRWAGDVMLLVGEERDTRQRSQRAICAVRYARAALQQSQVRLLRDLLAAVISVMPFDNGLMDRVPKSPYYKMH